jgi:hypothetical protein
MPKGAKIWNVIGIDLTSGERFIRETCIQKMVASSRAAFRNRLAVNGAVENDEPRKYEFVVEESVVE